MGLALCVFVWGLQYKLSLYDSPKAASHQVPKAKLLSKNEQSTISEESIHTQGKLPAKVLRGVTQPHLLILVAVFILGLPAVRQHQLWANSFCRIRRVNLDAFFVRPPPSLA